MDRFTLIAEELENIKKGIGSKKDYKCSDEIIAFESKNYETFSKLIYDIFLFLLDEIKDSNYSFNAYKSWHIKTKELELFWDGRDQYLLLWEISNGDKKTLKIIETDNINFKIIDEYIVLINTN